MASKFYRFTMRRIVRYVAVLGMTVGWTLMILAANTPSDDDTSVHITFLATVFGGALAFMAMLAGVSRWVAMPAARQVISEHIRDGSAAHKDLLPRDEYQEKHAELLDRLARLSADVGALPTKVLLELEGRHRN